MWFYVIPAFSSPSGLQPVASPVARSARCRQRGAVADAGKSRLVKIRGSLVNGVECNSGERSADPKKRRVTWCGSVLKRVIRRDP